MHKIKEWYRPCSSLAMLNVTVDKIGELAVVRCEGRIVQSNSAYKLREAVTSLTDARIVVLELSEVSAIGGGGFGMLVFLQRWAREKNVRFLLFNPTESGERFSELVINKVAECADVSAGSSRSP